MRRLQWLVGLVCALGASTAMAFPAAALADGPTAIGQDNQGVSYVGYAGGGSIARYDGSGNPLSSWGTAGNAPGELGGIVAISVDPNNNVWVLDTNLRVQEFTTAGTYEGGFSIPPCAGGVTPDPVHYGGLAVTATSVFVGHPCDDTLLRYSTSGTLQQSVTLPGRPRGVADGPAGSNTSQVFVALPDQHEVLTYDGATFSTSSSEPPLTVDGAGSTSWTPAAVVDKNDCCGDELIVSDIANNYVYVYDPGHLYGPDGTYSEYRTLGHGTGSSLGSVNEPVAMALHANDGSGYDTNLFVADYGNQRIQRWNDSGYTFWGAAANGPSSGGGGGTPVPTNTVAPQISGTPLQGDQLSCGTGTWNGSPTSYAYTWQNDGNTISGQTSSIYTIQPGDVGQSITCTVIASNSGGPSAPVTSTAVVPSSSTNAPANTAPPQISGTATPGDTLTCNTGTWTGTSPISYSYTWDRNGIAINNAAAQVYVVNAADVSQSITCIQTASNGAGNASATSAAVMPTAAVSGGPVGVSIDAGAIYTNNPDVTLTIIPPAGATSVVISNDGGFQEAQTFAVNGNDTYSWTLQVSGNERLPKTVYVRFVGASSPAYLTLTDDIILDTTAPTIQAATIAPSGPAADIASAARATGWVLHVKAKDKISGVAKLQYAAIRGGLDHTVKYARTVRVSSLRSARWVRVIDGAGNIGRWHRVARA